LVLITGSAGTEACRAEVLAKRAKRKGVVRFRGANIAMMRVP
jgi:hypothetical protein